MLQSVQLDEVDQTTRQTRGFGSSDLTLKSPPKNCENPGNPPLKFFNHFEPLNFFESHETMNITTNETLEESNEFPETHEPPETHDSFETLDTFDSITCVPSDQNPTCQSLMTFTPDPSTTVETPLTKPLMIFHGTI
ncbi:hypothetical protein IWQ61_009741 [Dispira simplex]|nr:hypothetical protein IWQ61_009741 [Dispira simplex]